MSFVKLFHIFWHKKWNITSRQCLYRYSWINLFCSRQGYHHGRPQEFFQRGAKPRGLTKMTKARTKIFAIFRRLRLNLRVFDASKNFRIFCTEAAYDIIIFKFQGGATAPDCPLRANGYHVRSFIYRQFCFFVMILRAWVASTTSPPTSTRVIHVCVVYFWCRFGVTFSHVLFTCFPRFTWC